MIFYRFVNNVNRDLVIRGWKPLSPSDGRSGRCRINREAERASEGDISQRRFFPVVRSCVQARKTSCPWFKSIQNHARCIVKIKVEDNLVYKPSNKLATRETEHLIYCKDLRPFVVSKTTNPYKHANNNHYGIKNCRVCNYDETMLL